jgi:polyferredoxin
MIDTDAIQRYLASGDWVGWIATSCFTLSYLVKKERTLLLLQGLASSIWLTYGLIIHAFPLVVANAIVAGSAFSKAVGVIRRERAAAASLAGSAKP